MTVAAFDPERHHIGLGPAAGTGDPQQGNIFGFLLAGGYSRTGQNLGSPVRYGGERDLIGAPILSQWTQDDFSGGEFAYTWGKDPAMFASSLNIVPSSFDRSVRTVPPFVATNLKNLGGKTPLWVGASDGYLFGLFSDGLHRWTIDGGAYSKILTLGATQADTPRSAVFDRNAKRIGILFDGAVINFYNLDGTLNQSYGNAPLAALVPCEGLLLSQSDLIFTSNSYVWKVAMPETGQPVAGDFLKVGRLPGVYTDSVSYNGLVYILCTRKDSPPILMQWVGSTGLLPVTEFPYNFQPECLQVYGGRIYVGGSGRDFSGGNKYAELYEVTGATLRLVRTFSPESTAASSSSKPKSIHSMAVYEGLLAFGETGRSLKVYDITSDGFFSASQLQPADGVRDFYKLLPYRDTMYAWVKHPLDANQDGWYRVCRAGTIFDPPSSSYDGVLVTSDFSPEPGRDKRWSVMKVVTRYGHCTVGYSLNGGSPGGDTFITLPSTSVARGDVRTTTVDLSGVPNSNTIRFRITMPRGQDPTTSVELLGFSVGFLFLSTGKWVWQFTVNGTERVESREQDTEKQNVHDIRTELSRYWREKVPLVFQDVTGESFNVQLTNYTESQPVIGPISHYVDPVTLDPEDGREALYSITLTEV